MKSTSQQSGRSRNRKGILSIRTKLLLITMTFLLLPWVGYRYILETQKFLLAGQEQALSLTAQAVATVLHNRPQLFDPDIGIPTLLARPNDFFSHQLDGPLQIDGSAADWGRVFNDTRFFSVHPWQCSARDDISALSFYNVLSHFNNFVYAFFHVRDDVTVHRDTELRRLNNSDHLRLTTQAAGGATQRYLFTARRPGRMSVYLMDADWAYPLTGEPLDIAAVQAPVGGGYNIEIRLPLALVDRNTRVGFSIADVDDPEARQVDRVLSTFPDAPRPFTRIYRDSPEISDILRGLDRPGARIWIIDTERSIRAVVGNPASIAAPPPPPKPEAGTAAGRIAARVAERLTATVSWLSGKVLSALEVSRASGQSDYDTAWNTIVSRALSDAAAASPVPVHRSQTPQSETQVLLTAARIVSADGLLGAVLVEQTSGQTLGPQNKLVQNIAVITFAVFVLLILSLAYFSFRLTRRIRKLRNASEQAITPEGRVRAVQIQPDARAADEIGDLSRGISSMLGKLNQYTRYLETMPDTLAHEISNPLNVVNSSLHNLEEQIPGNNEKYAQYVKRAQNGLKRLRSIITNLTEAANLEDAMHSETLERLNLCEFVSSYVEGCQVAHPGHRFIVERTIEAQMISASAEHFAQMLDKLTDNAVEFGDRDSPVLFRINRMENRVILRIINSGAPLPEDLRERIFDPMVSLSQKSGGKSHLGLGLYVARMIAEHHGGHLQANQRQDAPGAVFTLNLPLAG